MKEDNHHSLDEIFNDDEFPSVLGNSGVMNSKEASFCRLPTPEKWQAAFCGTVPHKQNQSSSVMRVCLHKEDHLPLEANIAYDIDSFLGFASSLEFARQGFFYQPVPTFVQNMTADLHIKTSVFYTDLSGKSRSRQAMLHHVPHLYLGSLTSASKVSVYVLFPHKYSVNADVNFLTEEELIRWVDQIFNPAIHRCCEPHYTQHMPSSFRHAKANSKAKQTEARRIDTASYQSQTLIGYHLQQEYLDQIWNEVLAKTENTPGLYDFREPQLFFSAKGMKLHFKTSPNRPRMLDTMEAFQTYLSSIIDLDFVYLDQLYIDIGKEICPRVGFLSEQEKKAETNVEDHENNAQIYSWKRCCLESYIYNMYNGKPPPKGKGQYYYEQNMLQEVCSLTSVTPPGSKLREGGLIYSQFYGSVKEISDALRCIPFNNDALEQMAIDPEILKGTKNIAGGRQMEISIIKQAYCASKCRARDSLRDSRYKSFGIREEHRIKWRLFEGLIESISLDTCDHSEYIMTDCPSYAYAIKTQTYLDYLWRNVNKFAAGFEIVHARSNKELVTWEQTKIMAMFLRCLRFAFGGHSIRRESALWWSRREFTTGQPLQKRTWYGLGFCNTLARYNYCWLEPRVDWLHLIFKLNITDHVLFGNKELRGQYLQRTGHIAEFFEASRRLDLALNWFHQHYKLVQIRERLISWMVHLCLRQFRVDILYYIKQDIQEKHQKDALQGMRPFCWEYFKEIMTDETYLVAKNRSNFKHHTTIADFLFNFDDGLVRQTWEDRPYRKLYSRVKAGLMSRPEMWMIFASELRQELLKYHWILPYPCRNGFQQRTNKGRRRMWFSIQKRLEEQINEAARRKLQEIEYQEELHQRLRSREKQEPREISIGKIEKWEWARKSWQAGHPKDLPYYLKWNQQQWTEWIASSQRVFVAITTQVEN
jgi:hypothetical protein